MRSTSIPARSVEVCHYLAVGERPLVQGVLGDIHHLMQNPASDRRQTYDSLVEKTPIRNGGQRSGFTVQNSLSLMPYGNTIVLMRRLWPPHRAGTPPRLV